MKQKSTLNLEASCDPAKVIAGMEVGAHQKVGTLYAFSDDFMSRANPAGGAPIVGFAGRFEILSSIGADDVSSNNLFLPEPTASEVRVLLKSQLYRNPEKPDKKSRGAISFSAGVLIKKLDADGNYAFGLEWIDKPVVFDALAGMKAKAKPAPKSEEPAIAVDEPKPTKPKGK